MKKVWMVLGVLLLVFQIQFFSTSTASEATESFFYISLYDDITKETLISNNKLSFLKQLSVLDTLKELKNEELIKDFTLKDGMIATLILSNDEKYVIPQSKEAQFIARRNGVTLSKDELLEPIQNGDIIEWLYTKQTSMNVNSGIYESGNKASGAYWTDETASHLNSASDWMNRNAQTSSFYLITMGIAGKTADAKLVNNLKNKNAKEQQYNTPTDIARQILATTFCGYDASAQANGQLVQKLSSYEDIMKTGIFGAVNALTAYDSNNYEVSANALNSRDKLIQYILEYQQTDGGFNITKGSASDIDTTAMTITALSSYQEREEVKLAIEKGFSFLQNVQTNKGGFGFKGQENCESLSTVIIALNAAGFDINDERFAKNGKNLLDLLLEYRNSDGGFGHVLGDKSTAMPTQQAIIALTSIRKSGNPYKLTTPVHHVEDLPTQHAAVISDNTPLMIGIVVLIVVLLCLIILYRIKRRKKYE